VIIVQAGSNCENLGVLDLTVQNDHVTTWDGGLHQLWYDPVRPKNVVSALVDSFKAEIDKEYSEIIGTLKDPWNMDGWETGVGNFISDAQREAANADVAFMNNHGIRKKLSPGPMTKQDLFEVLPFRNILTTFRVTGKQLRDAPKSVQIVRLLVNGKPVDDNATYTGAASDYLMGEAKRYLGIDPPQLTHLNETVFNAVEKKIRAAKIVISPVEGRIRQIK
jgi:2',3'-cyclic-nucleotide 2'-phosphodiesterase (5'-nucleotidase family)